MTRTKHYVVKVIGLIEPTKSITSKVSPKEFLSWAEKDLATSDKRARGNALSNLKKALHARLDELIERTHLRFTNDWDQRYVTTDRKLEVIRKLGIKHEAVVALITSIRNDYEHAYLVPNLKVVKAHLGAAELWLEKSYESYDFHPVAFGDLPLTGICVEMRDPNQSVIRTVSFGAPEKVSYFWNSKRKLITLNPDGRIVEKAFKTLAWKEMLRIEAPLIKTYYSTTSRSDYNQASLTDLYRRYSRWLSTNAQS